MNLIYVAIAVVLSGWLLMLLTSATAELHRKSGFRIAALAVWLLIVTVGWMSFAFIAYSTAGGLDGAWAWTLTQPLPLRIAMWVCLLPYMLALGIWQLPWVVWHKTVAIAVIAVGTFLMSLKRG